MEKAFIEQLIQERSSLKKKIDHDSETLSAMDVLIGRYQAILDTNQPENKTHFSSSLLPVARPKFIKSGYKPYYDALDNPPLEYSKNLSHVQLAVFGLKNLGKGDKYEIATYILGHDNTLSKEVLFASFSTILSRMFNEGLIGAYKIGNKNVYHLLTKESQP